MADILVAYYSRSGVTEGLARRLAETLGADLDAVTPQNPYAGGGGFFRGAWHSVRRRAPQVAFGKDPAAYRVVVIGSPVWAARLSAPIRTYLQKTRGGAGALAAFWVSGSGQAYDEVPEEIAQIAGRSLAASAHFAEREVKAGDAAGKLDALAEAIRALPG